MLTSLSLPRGADEAEEAEGEEGGKTREGLQTKPDNDVVMGGCYTNRHESGSEKPGLLENNNGESGEGMWRVGGRTNPQELSVLLPPPHSPQPH